ncbi:MAG: hypothetical protein K2K72_01760, partial [Duncaniella sp.]|nr:hypothetical protein [Duncaniella sp.]
MTSWIDRQEDYYLHDFSKDPDNSDNAEKPADTPSKPQFQFDRQPEQSPTPQRPAPRRHRGRKVLLWFIFIVLLVGGGAFWLRYLNPYTVDSLVTGYITNVDKQGLFFKTYEGQM